MKIDFYPIENHLLDEFIECLQKAFSVTIYREFGKTKKNLIPSCVDIIHAIQEKNAESYFIYADNKKIGGCIVNIDTTTNCNRLDFLFINKGMEGVSLGEKIWKAIERRYPDTKRWTTITPYFERRNIHFYINKCKFKAVEFMHPSYKNPIRPVYPILQTEYYFYFEKDMSTPK